ncbi:Ig-like domain-containing protein [Proteiniphilum sp. UBA5384]|uniref:Ig-like domain-containing protein n=1 Tax=Proteiniphilum sp. UBA5384 TaxID=1947279 RepID=UPI0025FA8F6D|nr:DUF4886 domain-containing protein [Proteiniphilum sp. UBA5384]
MKKLFLNVLAATLLVLTGCSTDSDVEEPKVEEKEGYISFALSMPSQLTEGNDLNGITKWEIDDQIQYYIESGENIVSEVVKLKEIDIKDRGKTAMLSVKLPEGEANINVYGIYAGGGESAGNTKVKLPTDYAAKDLNEVPIVLRFVKENIARSSKGQIVLLEHVGVLLSVELKNESDQDWNNIAKVQLVPVAPATAVGVYKSDVVFDFVAGRFEDSAAEEVKALTFALSVPVNIAKDASQQFWGWFAPNGEALPEMKLKVLDANDNVLAQSANSILAENETTEKGSVLYFPASYDGDKLLLTEGTSNSTPVTEITINKEKATLYKTESLEITVLSVLPEEADNKTMVWSSSNPAVAEVDQTGKVQAKSAGETTITVTAADESGVFASCKIVVTDTYNVMLIGNHFLDEAVNNHLLEIIRETNIKDKINISWMYKSDYTLKMHYQDRVKTHYYYWYSELQRDEPIADFRYWTRESSKSLEGIYPAKEWNLVVLAEDAGTKDEFDYLWKWDNDQKKTMEDFMGWLLEKQQGVPKTAYMIPQPLTNKGWWGAILTKHFEDSQEKMYDAIIGRTQRMLNDIDFDFVISKASVIQNLRSSSMNDATFLTASNGLLNEYARYASACLIFETLFGDVFNVTVKGNGYRSAAGKITDESAPYAWEAARRAKETPFEVQSMDIWTP